MVLTAFAAPALCLPGRLREDKETQTLFGAVQHSYTVFTQTCPSTQVAQTQTTAQLIQSLPYCQKLKSELTSTKLNLITKAKGMFNKKKQTEMFSKLCDKYLTKDLSQLVKAQVNLKQHHCGNRYTDEYKLFCFKLYHTSPHAYHLLSETLKLPSEKTITRLSIPVTSEITDDLLSILRAKVQSMSDLERNCTVVMGIMGLRASLFYNSKQDKIVGFHEVDGVRSPRPATSALVMSIRGLFCDYSQPVGYALLSESKNFDDVLTWINKVLKKLFDIGLHVRALVSDLASEWLTEAIRRTVSSTRPYFFLNDRKIYFILDAPYLLKLVRNKLLQNDIHFQDSVAKFQHVEDFYKQDSQKCFKLAPELTSSHIKPSTAEKRSISYARELLSKNVATGISTYVDFHAIDESGKGTSRFISMIDNLFDALSSSPTEEATGHKRAFCGDEIQLGFFNEMLELFQSLKVIHPKSGNDVSNEAYFIEEFKITMKSILQLFGDLKIEGHKALYTCRLHNDVHHNFIEQMRAQIGKTRKPTCRLFVIGFMTIFFSNIIKPKNGSNTNQKFENVFLEIRRVKEMRNLNASEDSKERAIQVAKADYDKLQFPESFPLLHLRAHLLKQCLDYHKDCAALKCYLKLDEENYNYCEDMRYLMYKYNIGSDKLVSTPLVVIPPDNFVVYVEEMERKFQEIMDRKHVCAKICETLQNSINEIPLWTPCACFPNTYLIKLFVMTKISNFIKKNNNAFPSMGKNVICRFS